MATGMSIRRMSDDELFLEVKRALNPIAQDSFPIAVTNNLSATRVPAAR